LVGFFADKSYKDSFKIPIPTKTSGTKPWPLKKKVGWKFITLYCFQVYLNVGIFEEELEEGVTTHQELFPHSMLSVVAEFIPYSDHNQSPRNMYQCQMSKTSSFFFCVFDGLYLNYYFLS